ncbi:unnamed protein product, partial [Fusarium fujikuroi]
EGRSSKFLPRRDLAFTEDPSIDDYAFGLRDDENDSLRKAILVAILGFDRILDVPLAFWRSGAMMNMHASLVKNGTSEHLTYELARRCVQASDEECDLETDNPNVNHAKISLFAPDDNEAGGIPSRPSDNPTLTHAPQAFDEAVATRLGAEDKLRAMALAVADQIPDLLEICQALYARVVQHVLESTTFSLIPSTLCGHHEDSEDSTGDEDDGDDGSGEEENESYDD